MAEGLQSDVVSHAPENFVLDLTGTDRYSWRLRSEPCMDADEIDEFHHGDKISAVRDMAHPGWLKLMDACGWVKESHDDRPVWKIAESQCSSQVLEESTSMPSSSGSKSTEDFAKRSSSKCSTDFAEENISSSLAGSSGSQNTAVVQSQAMLLPIPFTGKFHRICDKEDCRTLETSISTVSNTRWFTGQCYRVALTHAEASVQATSYLHTGVAERPRWADMEDTDEEDVAIIPKPHVIEMKEELLDGASRGLTDQSLPNSRSRQRNRALMQKKQKTQLCKYLSEKGACPFGDACWFAHNENDLRDQGNKENDDGSGVPSSGKTLSQDEMPICNENPCRDQRRRAKNKDLLKKRNRTELCQYFKDQQCCKFGDSCWFAHSVTEIRPTADK